MFRAAITALVSVVACSTSLAQILEPEFAADYVVDDLGSVPAVPPAYGGLTFSPADSNIMLIGGAANAFIADVFAVRVSRNIDGFITGFICGDAQFVADANGTSGGIDGGLAFGPGNVLFYTTYSSNQIGQIKPDSTGPDRLVDLTPLGVWPSTGSVAFVPEGFAGAGRMKIVSYNGGMWYDATVSPDRNGTYDITLHGSAINIGGGPEGVVYVAGGNPGFASDSILVSEYSTGRVVAYEADANGDPIVTTRRVFISGLGGAEGATIDPVTGDFLFATFGGGNRVIRVSGFTAITNCPGDIDLNNLVDLTDLALLLANFGQVGIGDLDGNCTTDLIDLAILLAGFGAPCP